MANEVATKGNSALPAHLQNRGNAGRIGNVDQTDLIIPRVKLLQAISPEVEEHEDAKAGIFWHNTMAENMGKELRAFPIVMRKTFALWAPRGDDRGILARASDGVHWDTPNLEFTIKPKGSPKDMVVRIGTKVMERVDPDIPAVGEFGSSVPGDPRSPPIAALTYEFLWFFPDYADWGPAIIINTRSAVKPAKDLLTKIEMRSNKVAHYFQAYKIMTTDLKGPEGPYKGYSYAADGYVGEEHVELMESMYKKYSDLQWKANDERADEDDQGGGGGGFREPAQPKADRKF